MPPARAVLEGVAGDIAKSARVIAYPRVNEDFPIALIIKKEILLPNPLLINAGASRNAQMMSHIVLLP